MDWDPSPESEVGLWGYLDTSVETLLPAVVERHLQPVNHIITDPRWVVLGSDEIVLLDEQVAKCPWGEVLYCGDRESAIHFLDLLKNKSHT